jgi:NAD(P)-dependent dehydrogenase (short-subunit alcohol dehydrogenase family)
VVSYAISGDTRGGERVPLIYEAAALALQGPGASEHSAWAAAPESSEDALDRCLRVFDVLSPHARRYTELGWSAEDVFWSRYFWLRFLGVISESFRGADAGLEQQVFQLLEHPDPACYPVSAAKATLEAHIRQLAVELAPAGITANAILAGVTDTNALRQVPGYEKIMEVARQRNANRRLTQPEDVARCIAALCHPATYWLTGNTLHVDGGENIVG